MEKIIMNLGEIRAKRVQLEFKLGGLISQFEDETGLDVGANIVYDRLWQEVGSTDGPTPFCQLNIEVGYGEAP